MQDALCGCGAHRLLRARRIVADRRGRAEARLQVEIAGADPSHLVGFEGMYERLRPNALLTLLASYFDTVADAVAEGGGRFDFIGDMVLAVGTHPEDVEGTRPRASAA